MPEIQPDWKDRNATALDFIVVGAGAAGAPLAARLVERGFVVLVVEMGPGQPDPTAPPPVKYPDGRDLESSTVPLLHLATIEDPQVALRYFVRHRDPALGPSADPLDHTAAPDFAGPHPEDESGTYYPRAQGLGGCSLHNAMITVCGPSEDWDQLTEATGDESWRGERMRAYFERLENCHYDRPSFLGRVRGALGLGTGWEGARHGHGGWLHTTLSDLGLIFRDRELLRLMVNGVLGAVGAGVEYGSDLLRTVLTGRTAPHLDPNNWQMMRRGGAGLSRIPCAITEGGRRSGPRERLLEVRANPEYGARLHILERACVTGVELDETAPTGTVGGVETSLRAVGIRCLPRGSVYEADSFARGVEADWHRDEVRLYCKREVILCGGAFNTPQVLMLSGIGPKEHLEASHIRIKCARDLPGVGGNLQDRYEVPIVATAAEPFTTLAGLGLSVRGPAARDDPFLQQWLRTEGQPAPARGVYSVNGGTIGMFVRSAQEDSSPDLFMFASVGRFRGYAIGCSRPAVINGLPPETDDATAAAAPKTQLTWLLLKGRTRQRMGTVRLRAASPFRRPEIIFRSFPGGDTDPDLLALVEGVALVRRTLDAAIPHTIAGYELPDLDRFGGDVTQWVMNTAWGHHASGTCRIGADDDPEAVLDSRFRVRGVQGLRVVDASVFPRIPGFFLVTNIYMVSEKAADVLTEDHPRQEVEIPPACRRVLERTPVLPSRPEVEARLPYPAQLEAEEAARIAIRRRAAGVPPPVASASLPPPPHPGSP